MAVNQGTFGIRAALRGMVGDALKKVRDLLAEDPETDDDHDDEIGSAIPNVRAAEPEPEAAPVQTEAEAADPLAVDPEADRIYEQIVDAIHTIFDPEIPVDIYELGLIYGIKILPDRRVEVKMTLTSPNCPSAQQLPEEVKAKAESVDGVLEADVEVVWEPTWTPEMMTEEARLELNF
jgi:FeS assembly SUF system protein